MENILFTSVVLTLINVFLLIYTNYFAFIAMSLDRQN